MIRTFLLALLFVFWPTALFAAEEINDFDVRIDVLKSGDIVVTETIRVTSEGNQIRRGIFRDLPRYYEKNGARFPYRYDVKQVERDGRGEPYKIERAGNAFRIRIGDADVFIERGAHTYEIQYAVKNQVRYFDSYDEVYWNATGNYWAFPIAKARAAITLPNNAEVIQTAAYTGALGKAGADYRYETSGEGHVFTTTRPMSRREGLTVAVGFEKGAVDPPSMGDRQAEWRARNASMVILLIGVLALTGFYVVAYNLVGRDPLKGPVFPRYEPPKDYSPAAVHHIYHRRFAGHRALIATLLNLAIKDRIKIDAQSKKKTRLTLVENSNPSEPIQTEAEDLLQHIFRWREAMTLGGKYDAAFTHAYTDFREAIAKKFGAPFFKWNTGFLIFAGLLSVAAVVLAIKVSIVWSLWHTILVGLLIILNGVFSYFMPAPTPLGQETRTEIEGFRLYLKTAEKLQLNAAKPGTNAPPPMSVERYERFLPYAVALGVEQPWTRHFERLMPKEAKDYQPRWADYHGGSRHSMGGLNRALVSSMSSGVTSALPQSSSSSGSGGGGFSGGGGGGGGGGGW